MLKIPILQKLPWNSRYPTSGFTLIELLVVFSIMAMLAGIGFVSFVSYSQQQTVTQAAENLKQYYTLAKFDAISSVKPSSSICQNNTLAGYQVVINTVSNSYELDALCNSQAVPIQSKTLPSQVSFCTSSAAPCVAATTCTTVQYMTISNTASGLGCTVSLFGYGKYASFNL